MSMTPTDDGPTGPGTQQDPELGAVSPLRQARDRGVSAPGAPTAFAAAYPSDIHRSSHRHTCPHCNGPIYRVRRRVVDVLLSVFVPVRRYRCGAIGCNWEGNLRTTQRLPPNERRDETPDERHETSAPS